MNEVQNDMPNKIQSEMRIAILDDYQACVRTLDAYQLIQDRDVTIFHDSVRDEGLLEERLKDFQVLVVIRERTPLSARLLERLPKLRLISAAGLFPNCIDRDACNRLGIDTVDGSGSGAPTAELCWALILASRRNLVQEANALRAGLWQQSLGRGLRGQTLGIWGYGRVGRQVARYGQAFGMDVRVWGSDRARAQALADGHVPCEGRSELFAESDVLSLHLKLVADTVGIVTPADLALMKTDALLVNTARAELIAPGALPAALGHGRPGFAAIDVFEHEPAGAASSALIALPNVLATPHIGFVERENYEAYYHAAFSHVLRLTEG